MKRLSTITSIIAAAAIVAGCQRAAPVVDNTTALADIPSVPETKDIVPSAPGNSNKAQLLASAEPFEGLTEAAFDPDQAKVAAAIAKAKSAAPAVRPLLSAQGQAMFDQHMADIRRAETNRTPADLALASVEIYRQLVTEGAGASPVPKEVSLLDYAGFRFTADLKATPSRWDDMAAAVDFAKSNWMVVKPQIKDATIAAKFQAALDNMGAAAAIKNADRAQASATAELDLVDVLEQSFNRH
ncbi:MAG: hypothetical protein M3R64_03200 [Pseudomonadota bacterium]|nr:hypothetical protein [Pseudomonadota bacterium]